MDTEFLLASQRVTEPLQQAVLQQPSSGFQQQCGLTTERQEGSTQTKM